MNELNETPCEIEGCTELGAMLDRDGVTRCQNHIVEKIFAPKEINFELKPRDKCPCLSNKKYRNCCYGNPLKVWFLQRVGTRIFWYDKDCDTLHCEECRVGKIGMNIGNPKHAVALYENAKACYPRKIFTNKLPDGKDQTTEGIKGKD